MIKLFLSVSVILLVLQGCAEKKPYHYPNYDIKNIQALLDSCLGKPYVWAEEGPNAFDCSGLTYNIYNKMGVDIPRTASEQAKMGKKVAFKDLQYGDLVFFGSTNKRSRRISQSAMWVSTLETDGLPKQAVKNDG